MSGLAERAIIAQIAGQQRSSLNLVKGIGDDCAVVAGAGGTVSLWTMDTLIESVHFDLAWHPPEQLGRKTVSVNVSDIAAMGGTPRFALFSLGLPGSADKSLVDSLLAGMFDVMAGYDITLAGGDTVFSPERIVLTLTLCGEMAADQVCYRAGAMAGDDVWVSGFLGEAAGGLALCRRGMHGEGRFSSLVRAHCDPTPQLDLGRLLAASGLIHAMLDLSDGLATDLAHICTASGVGAEIVADQVPFSPVLLEAASELRMEPLDLALAGGEDYQLLFTVPAEKRVSIEELGVRSGHRLFRVGKMVAGDRVILRQGGKRRDITFGGYEHRF